MTRIHTDVVATFLIVTIAMSASGADAQQSLPSEPITEATRLEGAAAFLRSPPNEITDPGTLVGAAGSLSDVAGGTAGVSMDAGSAMRGANGTIVVLGTAADIVLGARAAAPPGAARKLAAPASLDPGASEFGVIDLDNGLRDCDLDFDKLKDESPFCTKDGKKDGSVCQRASVNQFPEVVRIVVTTRSGPMQLCSGTLVAANWVLTAAHCLLGEEDSAAVARKGLGTADVVWDVGEANGYVSQVLVEATNAKLLTRDQRLRVARRIVINGRYGGRGHDPDYYSHDLALLMLNDVFPHSAVPAAGIARTYLPAATIAGFGYSNANGGTFGKFNLTWPAPLAQSANRLEFSPAQGGDTRSAFCQGDSGGPAFVGRLRGCKPGDVAGEGRPHLLQGVISYDDPGGGPVPAGNTNVLKAEVCRKATRMVMQDLTTPDTSGWICGLLGENATGCER